MDLHNFLWNRWQLTFPVTCAFVTCRRLKLLQLEYRFELKIGLQLIERFQLIEWVTAVCRRIDSGWLRYERRFDVLFIFLFICCKLVFHDCWFGVHLLHIIVILTISNRQWNIVSLCSIKLWIILSLIDFIILFCGGFAFRMLLNLLELTILLY